MSWNYTTVLNIIFLAARRGARRALLPQGRRPRDAADDEQADGRGAPSPPPWGRNGDALCPLNEASKLRQAAGDQISELIVLLSGQDEGVLNASLSRSRKARRRHRRCTHVAHGRQLPPDRRISPSQPPDRFAGGRRARSPDSPVPRRSPRPLARSEHRGSPRPTVAMVRAATAATTRQGPSSFRAS